MIKCLRLLAVLGLCGILSACSPKPAVFNATDITGATFGGDFQLTDHTGQRRTLADYRGKAVLLFFGYTFCPDVCPTTLGEAAAALKLLGADADRVRVVFVTVDPERDTQALLSRYVPEFGPEFVGLRGDRPTTDALLKTFRVYAKRVGEGDNYTVDHLAGSYLYDPEGRIRLFATSGMGPKALADDLRALLGAG